MAIKNEILNNGINKAEHNNIKYIDTMWIACILMALIATISICYSIWLVSVSGSGFSAFKSPNNIKKMSNHTLNINTILHTKDGNNN